MPGLCSLCKQHANLRDSGTLQVHPHKNCPAALCHICRVLFQDAAGGLFLYDAQRGELMVPPDWAGGQLRAAAWDGADQRLVAAVSSAGELRWGLAGFGLCLEVADHDARPCNTFFTNI